MSQRSRAIRRVMFVSVATVAVNALLLLSLEWINRPSPTATPEPTPSRVRLAHLPEPREPYEEPEPDPPPPEDEPLPSPDVPVDMPAPTVEPLDLPEPSLDVSVRVPSPPVRDVPTSPRATDDSLPAAAPQQAGPMRDDQVDVAPRAIRNPQPPYPAAARRRGIEGHVTVDLLVDARGQVSEVRITDRQGPPSFERAVRQTMLDEWAFEPGEHEGQAVPTWTRVRIEFRIQ